MAFKIRLNPETHRLTNLPGEKHPHKCQRCGAGKKLERWIECDHNDKPEHLWLVLCKDCGAAVIEKHPRLYIPVPMFGPVPGCMTVCVECIFRDGVRCKNPDAQINGGKVGLKYDQEPPAWGFIDGPRYRGRIAIYQGPVKACSGFRKAHDQGCDCSACCPN